jgi:hypothetical protein
MYDYFHSVLTFGIMKPLLSLSSVHALDVRCLADFKSQKCQRKTGNSMVKIRRKKSKKRYLGEKNVYEYEQLWVGIPTRFREAVEPFLGKELDMDVKAEGDSKVVIVLTSQENVSGFRK